MSAVISRAWAMPSHETFSVPPIGELVQKYLSTSAVSVDPFARNNAWATHTNDLNPSTTAAHHMDAADFLAKLVADGVQADLVILDPPYSPRQVKDCYESFGRAMTKDDALASVRSRVKDAAHRLIIPGGVVLSFGWNTAGMGTGRGYEQIEILIVCHGGDHNDTLCVAERRLEQR